MCALAANLHLIVIGIHLGSWQLSGAVCQPDSPADHEVTPGGFQRDTHCICNKWYFGIQEASFFRKETDHERDVRIGRREKSLDACGKASPPPTLEKKQNSRLFILLSAGAAARRRVFLNWQGMSGI